MANSAKKTENLDNSLQEIIYFQDTTRKFLTMMEQNHAESFTKIGNILTELQENINTLTAAVKNIEEGQQLLAKRLDSVEEISRLLLANKFIDDIPAPSEERDKFINKSASGGKAAKKSDSPPARNKTKKAGGGATKQSPEIYIPDSADECLSLGRIAYSDKCYSKAKLLYEHGAKKGNAEAMYDLGMMYINGIGVDKNFKKGRRWITMAADKRNTNAIIYIDQLRRAGKM